MGSQSIPLITGPKQFLLWLLRNKVQVTCEIILCLGSFCTKPSAYSKTLVFCEGTFHSWHQSIWPLNLWCQESFRQSLSSGSKISDLQLFFAEIHIRLYSPHRREVSYLGMFGSASHARFSINNLSTQSPTQHQKGLAGLPQEAHAAREARLSSHIRPVQIAHRDWGYLYKHKNMCCSPLYLHCLF